MLNNSSNPLSLGQGICYSSMKEPAISIALLLISSDGTWQAVRTTVSYIVQQIDLATGRSCMAISTGDAKKSRPLTQRHGPVLTN